MLLTPMPGAHREELLRTLHQLETDAVNLRGRFGQLTATDRFRNYIDWVHNCGRMLSGRVRPAEVEALFQTRRYELILLSNKAYDTELTLMTQELDDRAAALEDVRAAMEAEFLRWTTPGRLIVFDANVYMEHEKKLEELDFWNMVGEFNRPIHLIAPIAVVDELDNLKNRGHDDKKWRAGYSLAVLDRVMDSKEKVITGAVYGRVLRDPQRQSEGGMKIEKGPVALDLLLDPPGHHRLPNDDDEIVDRALSVQAWAGKPVTMVSHDTGMIMRARTAGLDVLKLVKEYGREPKKR